MYYLKVKYTGKLKNFSTINMRKLLFLLLFPIALYAQVKPEQPVNVLVIMADDMSLNAGIYGDQTIETPNIDGVGKDGVIFQSAHCTASSCTPSRASILTGKYPHQLKEGGSLWGFLPIAYPTYIKSLRDAGYNIGLEGKGWGPGNFRTGGYTENPAGKGYKNFEKFIEENGTDKPFCFWVGSHDPHRPYKPELKNTVKFNESALKIPSWIPDNEQVRNDYKDYYAAVKRFDNRVGQCISLLKEKGLYDKTLIIVSSDNGRPFPRSKANNYNESTNIPLVIRWGNRTQNGTKRSELVSLVDLAPTILEATGQPLYAGLSGASLLPLVTKGQSDKRFDKLFTERERHSKARAGDASYPIRAIHTKDFIYIINLRPDRWPAGDPDNHEVNGAYGDIDNGGTKKDLVVNRKDPAYAKFVMWSLDKRPAEELYDLHKDPDQLVNVAADKRYAKILQSLKKELANWRSKTNDPVKDTGQDIFDTYPHYSAKDEN